MGTICSISLPSDTDWSLFDNAFDEIDRVESVLSTWRTDTELARINDSTSRVLHVSEELSQLLSTVKFWAIETAGSFTPLIGPLIDVWSSRRDGRRPSPNEIAMALDRMHIDGILIDADRHIIQRPPGTVIEEGAFGKGYALDVAMRRLADAEIDTAYIDFGGQIAIRSSSPVEVAIAHPESRGTPAIVFRMTSGSLATTSGSERAFEVEGVTLSHIIDPRTGSPLPPRGSVSVFHQSALVADILSTALYVMGPDEGLAWADEHRVAVLYLIPKGDRSGRYQILPSNIWRSDYPVTTTPTSHQFVMEDILDHETSLTAFADPVDSHGAAVGTDHD